MKIQLLYVFHVEHLDTIQVVVVGVAAENPGKVRDPIEHDRSREVVLQVDVACERGAAVEGEELIGVR